MCCKMSLWPTEKFLLHSYKWLLEQTGSEAERQRRTRLCYIAPPCSAVDIHLDAFLSFENAATVSDMIQLGGKAEHFPRHSSTAQFAKVHCHPS